MGAAYLSDYLFPMASVFSTVPNLLSESVSPYGSQEVCFLCHGSYIVNSLFPEIWTTTIPTPGHPESLTFPLSSGAQSPDVHF